MLNKLRNNSYLVLGAVAVGGAILFWVLFAWFSASSETNVPKAEDFNKQSSNSHIESVKSEGNANVTAEQVKAIDARRIEADRMARVAKATKNEAVNKLNKRTDEYETFRKKGTVVSSDDLDARERKLLSDLANTYPNR